MDTRYRDLARLLVDYSVGVREGDRVLLVSNQTVPLDMKLAVLAEVRRAGGFTLEPVDRDLRLLAAAMIGSNERTVTADAGRFHHALLSADKRIEIRGYENPSEPAIVPPDKMQLQARLGRPHWMKEFVGGPNWVLTCWPTQGFAAQCRLSTPEAEAYYFDACLGTDYRWMTAAVRPLAALMARTDQVHIVGPGDTDLRFSIKGIGAVPCVGKRNVPDGECYTAPVRESVEGVIHYNTPTASREGDLFEGIRFVFRQGRIVDASCAVGNLARLWAILETDPGARYVGEFSLGFNPKITRAIRDTLFDEKMAGSLHFTPGNAYDNAQNGNVSAIHWDLVMSQQPAAGGGQIFFDGKLIREHGLFVPKNLRGLNP